jgi:hypothetical protein
MLFVLEYDRAQGRIVRLDPFSDAERTAAEDARLDLELRLGREGLRHEIVLLEAASEHDLRLTHRRYFENVEQLRIAPPDDASRV